MGLDLSCSVARHQNSLLPHLVVAAVAVAVAIHAHIEAGNMEAWLGLPLACPNRFSWRMTMMYALKKTIGGSGAVLGAGG